MRKIHKIVIVLSIVVVLQLLIASVVYAAPPLASPRWHRVQRCETLFSIGRLYGVSPWAIAQANGLCNPNLIYAGQCLSIPGGPAYPGWCSYPARPQPARPWGGSYVVRRCDTLYSIARHYGVGYQTLAQYNGIANPNCICAGQRLCVPSGGAYCPWGR